MRKILLILCVMALALASCKRRPLTYGYYPYSDILLVPDWSQSLVDEEKPQGVSAIFYPKDGGEPLSFRSGSVDGFSVPIPVGVYDIMVFNRTESEFSTIGFKGMDKISTAELYSFEDDSKSWYSKTEDELVVKHPEKIATVVHHDFEVTPEMIATTSRIRLGEPTPSDTVTKIHVIPELVTKVIDVRIKVIGIHNLRSARATISGMAYGHWVQENKNNTTDATYILSQWSAVGQSGEGELYFKYNTFGLKSDTDANTTGYDYWKGFMNLEILLVDNKTTLKFPLPLDPSMITENSAGEVDLTITIGFDPTSPVDPPVLPDVEPEEGGEAGFNPEIGGWEDPVEIPIPLG